MVTRYPAAIDTVHTLLPIADGRPVTGGSVEQLRQAIIAIEEELGVRPSGVYATVRARLDSLENIVGNLRIIELDQDLGGSLEDPRVIGIHGRPISDVPPGLGQAYIWNGIAWAPGSPAAEVNFAGDLTGTPLSQTVVGINTIPVEQGDESNVGQFLKLVQETSGFITANHYDGQNLWLLGLNSNQLYKVNSAIPSLVSTIELPFENINTLGSGLGNWITSDATHIYVAIITSDVSSAGKVYIIEKSTGNIVGRVDSNWNQDPKYIYNVIVNGDDIIIATGSAGNFNDGADGYIEKYSKTEALAAYPSPATRQGVLTGIGIGAGCLCIGSDEGTPKLFATSYQLNTLYRINIDSLTVEDSFSSENMSNCTIQPGGQYIWVTGYQDVDAGPILVARFNVGSINGGPVTVSSPLGVNYRYITADNEGVWTSSPESSTIHRISGDTFDIIASPSNSPILYLHLVSDGTWLWASQLNSVGSPGVDAFSTGLGAENYDHHFTPVLGELSIIYADSGGSGGGGQTDILIYRPDGTASENVYTNWTNLMNARNDIDGPATIVIDDSITSPAVIDIGIWELLPETKIVGNKGYSDQNNTFQNMTVLQLDEGVQLKDVTELENIVVTGNSSSTPCMPYTNFINLKMRSTILQNNGTASMLYVENGSYADYNTIQMFESSRLGNAAYPIFEATANGIYRIYLNDNSEIWPDTIAVTGGISSLEFRINDWGATYSLTQSATSAAISAITPNNNQITGNNSLALGTDNVVTAQNSAILWGTGNQISTSSAVIAGGNSNSIFTEVGGTIGGGNSNTVGGDNGTVSGGTNNNAGNSASTVGGGSGNSASGSVSTVGGGLTNFASGNYSTVPGGLGANAIRAGQLSHAGAPFATSGDAQWSRYFVKGISSSGSPVILRDYDSNELQGFTGTAYAIRATCIANSTTSDNRAMFIHTILAHYTDATGLVIDLDDPTLLVPNGTSWDIAFTVTPNGMALRATFTGSGSDDVFALVTYEFSEIANGFEP